MDHTSGAVATPARKWPRKVPELCHSGRPHALRSLMAVADSRSSPGEPRVAQVHARYIAGLPKVNHRTYTKGPAKPCHQTSGHRALAIRHDLQRIPGMSGRVWPLAPSPPLAGVITERIWPLGHVAVAMFAPCLLGCRVPTRQRTVRCGTRTGPIATYLGRHYYEVAASSDRKSNRAADS